MGSILNDADRAAIRERIGSVTSSSTPRWGRMDTRSMLAHLKLSALMALGELPVASKSKRVFQVFPVKHLILHVVPFPKSAPTAPELLVRSPAAWQADVAELQALVDRFVARGRESSPWPEHPAFGRLSHRAWGVLTYRHMDHHLRQFGT